MATKRSKKRHSARHDGPESPEHMLDRVLGAFEHWLAEREPDPERLGEVAGIARTACELKSSYFGEANPAEWSPQLADELVGQVFPRKVVVDDGYARAVVPALLTYVEFLVTTGRWKPHNDSFATRRALSNLEADLPGRFNDPERQSMGDGGLWAMDPAAGPDDDDFDDEELIGDEDVDEALAVTAGLAVAALGFEPGEVVTVTVPAAESELAALLDTPLLSRIRALSDWARPGQRLTSSGAMRRVDTTAWLSDFGIVAPSGSSAGSMWDWPELAAPWGIAIAMGMIDVSGTKARAGEDSAVFDSADLPIRISCARRVVDLLIFSILDNGDEPSDLDVVVALTVVPALALMCRPEGVDLAAFRALAVTSGSPAEDFGEALTRIVVSVVANIISTLELWGFAVEDRGRARIPEFLRPALVQAINAPGAPFSITLAPGAVPLLDDEI